MTRGVVTLANGKTEVILNNSDIVSVVESELGYDFGNYILELIQQADKTKVWAEQKLDSDLDSYEATMESQRSCLSDILYMVEKLQEIISSPRIKKQECLNIITQIKSDICNEI